MEEVKSTLKAITVSINRPLTWVELEKEYELITGDQLALTLRKLGYGTKNWGWNSDDRFWFDFRDVIHRSNDGHIYSHSNNDTLQNMIATTRQRSRRKRGGMSARGRGSRGRNRGGGYRGGGNRRYSREKGNIEFSRPDKWSKQNQHESTRVNCRAFESEIRDYHSPEGTLSPIESVGEDEIPVKKIEPALSILSRSSSTEVLANGEVVRLESDIVLYDSIENDKPNNSFIEVMVNLIDLLFHYPHGINVGALKAQIMMKCSITFGDMLPSWDEFLQSLKKAKIIKYIEIGDRGRVRKTQKQRSKTVIVTPLYKLLLDEDKPITQCQNIVQGTSKKVRDTFKRLVRMLALFGHGIFIRDIEEIYRSIYNEQISDVSDVSLDEYLNCVWGFKQSKSPTTYEDYVHAETSILNKSWSVFSFSEDKMLNTFVTSELRGIPLFKLMQHLLEIKRLRFTTVLELGAQYASCFRIPLRLNLLATSREPHSSLFSLILVDPRLTITERHFIERKHYSVCHFKDYPLPEKVIQKQPTELVDGEEYSIGDVFNNGGTITLIPMKLYENTIQPLHRMMKQRYDQNFDRDLLDINDVYVGDFVALKAGSILGYNGLEEEWYRAEVRSIERHSIRIYCVDNGIEKEGVTGDEIRSLLDEYIEHYPNQAAIYAVLSNQTTTLSPVLSSQITDMMNRDNCFRVHLDSETNGYPTVSLTHVLTEFTFNGELNTQLARTYRHKCRQLQARQKVYEVNPAAAALSTISSNQATGRSTVSETEPHETKVYTFSEGQSLPLTIVDRNQVCVDLNDVSSLVKQLDRSCEIKFRLLLRKVKSKLQGIDVDHRVLYKIVELIDMIDQSNLSGTATRQKLHEVIRTDSFFREQNEFGAALLSDKEFDDDEDSSTT